MIKVFGRKFLYFSDSRKKIYTITKNILVKSFQRLQYWNVTENLLGSYCKMKNGLEKQHRQTLKLAKRQLYIAICMFSFIKNAWNSSRRKKCMEPANFMNSGRSKLRRWQKHCYKIAWKIIFSVRETARFFSFVKCQ